MQSRNVHEERIRDFIANEERGLSLRELVRRVVAHEFGDLMALDHLIPRDLPERYSDLLFENPDASTYLLQFLGGKPGTEIHDHGKSAGCVVVLKGIIKETIYGARHVIVRHLRGGRVISFAPGYVHKFEDGGDGEALSLHFYEPPLVMMGLYAYNDQGILVRSGEWKEKTDAQPAADPAVRVDNNAPSGI